MGYTHYASRGKRLPLATFQIASNDCRKVVEALCRKKRIRIQFGLDVPQPAHFGDDCVQFNGVGGEAHETFVIERNYRVQSWNSDPKRREGWPEFTKTARKPYDGAVCACLIVFQHHFGNWFQVSSDGDDKDKGWTVARICCQRVLGYGADFTLDVPPKMTVNGLAFTGPWCNKGDADGQVRPLANGWEVRKPCGTSLRYGVYDLSTRKNGGFIVGGDILRAVIWHATVTHFRSEFADAPFLDEFVNAMLQLRGEWTSFLAWSDKLQDHGHDQLARKVRQRIPQ